MEGVLENCFYILCLALGVELSMYLGNYHEGMDVYRTYSIFFLLFSFYSFSSSSS